MANYEDPMPVDFVYRQDKCIRQEDFNINGLDYIDLTTEHGGKISCLQACQTYNTSLGFRYQLAFINDHFCTCATYASLPSILRGFRTIQPQKST